MTPSPMLRRIAQDDVDISTRIAHRHVAEASAFALTLDGIGHLPAPHPSVRVDTAYGPLAIAGAAPLCALLTGVDPASAGTDAALAAALLDAGFSLLPEPVATLLGHPMPKPPGPGSHVDTAAHWLRLHCRADDASVAVLVGATPPTWLSLLEAGHWTRLPRSHATSFDALPARIAVVAGSLTLPAGHLRTLGRGDVLRPDTAAFDSAGRGQVRIGPLALTLHWHDPANAFAIRTIEINDIAMTQQHDSDLDNPAGHSPAPHGTTLDDDAIPANADLGTEPEVLDSVPVRLRFVIGELDVTLGGLRELAAGQYLKLHKGLPPAVSIEANDAPVGHGELVDCDGTLAVQITRWLPRRQA
ncbi:type III secretion system cytoplasmic ring protein SctQ [Trinickia mobilis]|uniref:type III secretion system cytoplasmic ring protein SctQ n=1 Tax=Trinickia mobilis TaxID=2816356 RepID=UPI001A8F4850|nr:type III secretion system cytoplasmic ring protein SctQ [Trinickia mobilis]